MSSIVAVYFSRSRNAAGRGSVETFAQASRMPSISSTARSMFSVRRYPAAAR